MKWLKVVGDCAAIHAAHKLFILLINFVCFIPVISFSEIANLGLGHSPIF